MDAPDLARQAPARQDTSYELVTHLAQGGMAELFIARRHNDASAPYVVLKRVMPEQARNPHFVGMFLDEARLASRLHHPNIAQVIDVGRAGSSYYYTMEYVHGENVRDLLQLAVKKQVMVPHDVTLSILIGAAIGLHAAHETRDRNGVSLGIVHRDVSPSNVMISYTGEIKLVDFGVAKAADHTTETQSGTVKGKIAYLSPEQCTVQPVDRRSDVFSLGIVAYEMVTRSRLFRRRSDYETMHAIVNDPVPPPSRLRPGVPAAIDAMVLRCLERSPAQRPQSAADVASELAAVAAKIGVATGPAVLARYMAELFGSRPLPWAHLDHQDTAVIELAALAPGLVPSEREPLEASVSAAEVIIDVDKAQSSSVDQAFAAVITTIAPPPREWGVGEEVPGVFTWPTRDEGVEHVDRTEMTSQPPPRNPRDVAARRTPAASEPPRSAFQPSDTVVMPSSGVDAARRAAGGSPQFPTARTETGAAPAPARRPAAAEDASSSSEGDAGSTLQFGKAGWLDEVKTTISDRASTAKRVASAKTIDARPENPGPRDTVLDMRDGPPDSAIDLAALRRAAGLSAAAPSRRSPPGGTAKADPGVRATDLATPAAKKSAAPAVTSSLDATLEGPGSAGPRSFAERSGDTIDDELEATTDADGVAHGGRDTRKRGAQTGDDVFDQRTTAPRAITRPPPTDPVMPAVAPPAPAPRAPAPARSRAPSQPNQIVPSAAAPPVGRRDDSSPRMPMPPPPSSNPQLVPPPGHAQLAPPRRDDSSPRMPMPPPSIHDSSPRVPMPAASHDPAWSPRMLLPGQHHAPAWPGHHHGTGPNPLVPPFPAPTTSNSRRVFIVVAVGAVLGGGIAIAATVALRPAARKPEAAPAPAPPSGPQAPSAEDLEAIRTRARAARTDGRWEAAYDLCRDGLRLAPSDVELTTICAHAACSARNPEAAGQYLRRVPPDDVRAVRSRCREAGVADPMP